MDMMPTYTAQSPEFRKSVQEANNRTQQAGAREPPPTLLAEDEQRSSDNSSGACSAKKLHGVRSVGEGRAWIWQPRPPGAAACHSCAEVKTIVSPRTLEVNASAVACCKCYADLLRLRLASLPTLVAAQTRV